MSQEVSGIERTVEHATNGNWTESRGQNPMSNFPVVLMLMCCDEAIVNTVSQLHKRRSNLFAEATLVADFVVEFMICDEDDVTIGHSEFEDWA